MNSFKQGTTVMRSLVVTLVLAGLAACAGPERPKPAPLAPNVPLISVRPVWNAEIGVVDFPLDVRVVDGRTYLAGGAGVVAAVDAQTGADVWRANVGAPLSAGVGTDGRFSAVVTRTNELVVLDNGKVTWRQRLKALTLTAPLVAGARVFTLSTDRTVSAFDAASGQRLWQQTKSGEALVLGQGGLLTAVGDTLLVGYGGRVAGLSPANGASRWETAVVSPRGTNEVERLVDIVSGYSREGNQICVRSFQYAVACVDGSTGRLAWSKPASGATGVTGDASVVIGSEGDGKLSAWKRLDGDKLWTLERYRFRVLSAPALAGRSFVVGDDSGNLHFLSKDDGAPLNRVSTDASGIAVSPVLSGKTLVVVSRRGSIYAFRSE